MRPFRVIGLLAVSNAVVALRTVTVKVMATLLWPLQRVPLYCAIARSTHGLLPLSDKVPLGSAVEQHACAYGRSLFLLSLPYCSPARLLLLVMPRVPPRLPSPWSAYPGPWDLRPHLGCLGEKPRAATHEHCADRKEIDTGSINTGAPDMTRYAYKK